MKTIDAAILRAAGREPPLPARMMLDDGRVLEILRSLRLLPGKRLTAEARLNGQPVLAKLFLTRSAARHAKRERAGLRALADAKLPTPAHVADGRLAGGGELVATRFFAGSVTLADLWRAAPRPPGDARAIGLLGRALALLARMHATGLAQSDLHLDNFLQHHGRLHLIDGATVERYPAPLTPQTATANLAILLAQFPPAWDAHLEALVAPYIAAGGRISNLPALLNAIHSVRANRLADILHKSTRNCTLFSVTKNATRFTSTVRKEAEALAPLLKRPDQAIHSGTLLKDGNTATVALTHLAGRAVVIKRYNLKNFRHAFSRMWRPSRAWHAWHAAHRLVFLDIATPAPLAVIEERVGPLRRRAYFITVHCPGPNLLELLDPLQPPPDAIAAALVTTFQRLFDARITHGDLKATNLLWHSGRIFLIDLDATTAHPSGQSFAASWARDRARLLRNWPEDSALSKWIDQNIPLAK